MFLQDDDYHYGVSIEDEGKQSMKGRRLSGAPGRREFLFIVGEESWSSICEIEFAYMRSWEGRPYSDDRVKRVRF